MMKAIMALLNIIGGIIGVIMVIFLLVTIFVGSAILVGFWVGLAADASHVLNSALSTLR